MVGDIGGVAFDRRSSTVDANLSDFNHQLTEVLMRIAVSTETNAGLDAPVAGHFGRCPFFTLIDLEAEQIQTCSGR
jgi:hypothetical protein